MSTDGFDTIPESLRHAITEAGAEKAARAQIAAETTDVAWELESLCEPAKALAVAARVVPCVIARAILMGAGLQEKT